MLLKNEYADDGMFHSTRTTHNLLPNMQFDNLWHFRIDSLKENYPIIPTDQYLTSRTQNTPALPYFFRSSLSSSTMPLSSE